MTRRLHIGFAAPLAGPGRHVLARGPAGGLPRRRRARPAPQYREDYYGGFLLDPDGNSVEAVHHGAPRDDGAIDHLWLRVADVAAASVLRDRRAASPASARDDSAEPMPVQGRERLVLARRRAPTEHVHMAFGADDDATVDGSTRVATAAGHRVNGAPGERPSTTPATTPPSSSTPTATTSSWSTTTADYTSNL